MRKGTSWWAASIAATLLVVGGCRQQRGTDTIARRSSPSEWAGFVNSPGPILTGHPVKFSDMSESERRYGIAPRRGPGIEYQPDIILMEHGDQAIRDSSSDGMSWTFDANAPQVSDFQPGKIVFATARAVGRVLALERHGDQVSAILGPVQLTDLVKRGKFAYSEPLDLSKAIAYVAPDYPGAVNAPVGPPAPGSEASLRGGSGAWQIDQYYAVSDSGQWTPLPTANRPSAHAGRPKLLRASFRPHPQRSWAMQQLAPPSHFSPGNLGNFVPSPIPIPFPNLPMTDFGGMQVTPCANCGGLGVKLYQEKGGVRVWISVVFHLINPHVLFYAKIENGSIAANLQLAGGAGVTVTLDAASSPNFQGNIKEIGGIPIDITVPIGGIFLPLEIDLSQAIDLESAFSAKTSTLHGEGGIGLTGEIMADYSNGWTITAPHGEVKQNLAGMISGVSVGINSLVFGINQRLMVGVGAFGFASGPYVSLTSSITSLRGSSIATTLMAPMPICTQGTFNMSLNAGIGYSMPRVVAKVINTVLSWFGVKPIPATGSIIALPKATPLIDHKDEIPHGCSG